MQFWCFFLCLHFLWLYFVQADFWELFQIYLVFLTDGNPKNFVWKYESFSLATFKCLYSLFCLYSILSDWFFFIEVLVIMILVYKNKIGD